MNELKTALATYGVPADELERAASFVADIIARKAWRDAHEAGKAARDAINAPDDAKKWQEGH